MPENVGIEYMTAPSYWASGLINGDWSGLSDVERDAALAWEENLPGVIVDVSEESDFMRHHDASQYALAADCATYTIAVHAGAG